MVSCGEERHGLLEKRAWHVVQSLWRVVGWLPYSMEMEVGSPAQGKGCCHPHYSGVLDSLVVRTQAGKNHGMDPHRWLNFKGQWWAVRSSESWTHPVSSGNGNHPKSTSWYHSGGLILCNAMKEILCWSTEAICLPGCLGKPISLSPEAFQAPGRPHAQARGLESILKRKNRLEWFQPLKGNW